MHTYIHTYIHTDIYNNFLWCFVPFRGHGLPLRGFVITLTGRTTVGRNPLDERSARSRDLYLTIHSTHKTQTVMPPAGLEPVVPASKRLQTHELDRAYWNRYIHTCMHTYVRTYVHTYIHIRIHMYTHNTPTQVHTYVDAATKFTDQNKCRRFAFRTH
jgi:hypothetical protein